MYLLRYHDVTISSSGIWRILKRLNMNRLPQYQRYKRHEERWKRYEKPEPSHRIQVDVKFLERIPGTRRRHYQYTAIDDCTRLRVLKIYDKCNQKTSIQFIDYVLSRFPFHAEVIQMDQSFRSFSIGISWIRVSTTFILSHIDRGLTVRLNAAIGLTKKSFIVCWRAL